MKIFTLIKEIDGVTSVTNIAPSSMVPAYETGVAEIRKWFFEILESSNNGYQPKEGLQSDQVTQFLREWKLIHTAYSVDEANKVFTEGINQAHQFLKIIGVVNIPEIRLVLVPSDFDLLSTGWMSDYPIYSGSIWGNMAAQAIMHGRTVKATHIHEDLVIVASPAEELEGARGTKITLNSVKGSVTGEVMEAAIYPGENWLLANSKAIYELANNLMDELFGVAPISAK